MLTGQRADQVQLGPAEHLAGRVVRGVQQDQTGSPGERSPQGGLVDVEVGKPQHRGTPDAAGQGDRGGIAVVVRLEGDDLVAGLAQAQDHRGDRLGRPGGDQDLPVGVHVEPVEPPLVLGDRGSKLGNADSGGYWLRPELIASMAASSITRGPSVSGKPCPRLIAPVLSASSLISAKIVVPKPCILATSGFPMSGRLAVP